MSHSSLFWVEMKSPTSSRILVKTESLRDLISRIRFLAATESAKFVAAARSRRMLSSARAART